MRIAENLKDYKHIVGRGCSKKKRVFACLLAHSVFGWMISFTTFSIMQARLNSIIICQEQLPISQKHDTELLTITMRRSLCQQPIYYYQDIS